LTQAVASIRSFIVHVRPGCRDGLAALLRREVGCEVYPAENTDLIVIVTDHPTRDDEEGFDERLAAMDGVAAVALVSGFRDDLAREDP
jgi:nitrate reductase NapAB chaperone NapD